MDTLSSATKTTHGSVELWVIFYPASFVYRDLLPVLEAEHHTVLVDDDPLDQSADVLLVKFRERLRHSGKGGAVLPVRHFRTVRFARYAGG